MKQNTEPRNSPTQVWPTDFQQKQLNGENSFSQKVLEQLDIHKKKKKKNAS